jgi:anaerobic magnesium-protoporphyrin IX monomethyl ester cyclase
MQTAIPETDSETAASAPVGPYDLILIGREEIINYKDYLNLPVDRIELYRELVQLRMTYFEGGFRPYLEIVNKALYGETWLDAAYPSRRELLSIWNFNSLNGALAVSQALRAGYRCKIVHNFDSEFDQLLEAVGGQKEPLIGISTTYILAWSVIARMVRQIREKIPGARIVLGGALINDHFLNKGAASLGPPMKKLGVNYAVYSYNSENDLARLMDALKSGTGLEEVKNLAWLDAAGGFHVNPDQWMEPYLGGEDIPWAKIPHQDGCNTLQVRTSTGCPFKCAFCTYPVIAKGFQYSELDGFRHQLEHIKKNPVEALIFIDDTFNLPVKRFKEILHILKDYKFRWYSFFRAQYCDEETARLMKESGCDGVYLGIESANDEVLKNMDKKSNVEQYRRGTKMLKDVGITTFAAFVLGFPGETQASIQDNIRFIEEGNLDYYSLKEFYYMPTAPVYQKREKFGLVGDGNNWTHSTMDSEEASRQKGLIYRSVKNSIYVDADTGLWYLAYLRDRGFSWQAIRESQLVLNKMMSRDDQGRYTEKDDLMAELKQSLAPHVAAIYADDARWKRSRLRPQLKA